MGRKRKDKYSEFDSIDDVIDDVVVDNTPTNSLADTVATYLADYDYPVSFAKDKDEIVITLDDMIGDVKTNQAIEVVVPVVGKINSNKVVVDYEGYGLMVNVDNANINKVTLRIYGVLGQADFDYEVV